MDELQGLQAWPSCQKLSLGACRLNHFKIIDYGLADFTEYYPSGRVDVGGPTHAVPKTGPLHFRVGQLEMSLPMPLSMEQLKALPKV